MDRLLQELKVHVDGTDLELDELGELYLSLDCSSPSSWSVKSLFQVYYNCSSMLHGAYRRLSHIDKAIMTLCFWVSFMQSYLF